MQIIGTGLDVVEHERIARAIERFGARILARIFTQSEQDYCQSQRNPAPHFAARFAAKEALAKALGCGIGEKLRWRDIEVVRGENGAPAIRLHGLGAQRAKERGVREIHLSLTHGRDFAAASVLCL